MNVALTNLQANVHSHGNPARLLPCHSNKVRITIQWFGLHTHVFVKQISMLFQIIICAYCCHAAVAQVLKPMSTLCCEHCCLMLQLYMHHAVVIALYIVVMLQLQVFRS